MNKIEERPLMVTIRCITYNHEAYIRKCLDGFVMQKTNFRFEAIVHDDASTDGTASIIREYAEMYPGIIKPIYETENIWSRHDGSLGRIMDEHTHGKYVATCEGDDYWIDPLKLQKQFDFMEENYECPLCFHAHYDLMPNGSLTERRPPKERKFYSVQHIILSGGGFMATNSMFYRWSLRNNEERPDFWKHAPIGDTPTMLFFAAKGKIGYINDAMSVYRRDSCGSWSSKQKSFETRKAHYKRIMQMFNEYDEYTNHKYHITILIKKSRNKIGYIKNYFISQIQKIQK